MCSGSGMFRTGVFRTGVFRDWCVQGLVCSGLVCSGLVCSGSGVFRVWCQPPPTEHLNCVSVMLINIFISATKSALREYRECKL